ncbi:MAG: hypothetical protein EA409_05145 [Saprospirales bacterium]|jgi:hypothetical protein|nr:MAG: hypothetical protein EA409_05145 [Saprospirales bacterium]
MNNLKLFIVAFLIPLIALGYGTEVLSQNKVTEGHLKMEITEVSMQGQSGNPEMEMAMEMMKGSTMELYFNRERELSVVNMAGGMSLIRTLMDFNTNQSTMFMEMMGQKMMVDLGEVEGVDEEIDFETQVNKNNRKNIVGFDCYEVIFTANIQGQNMQMTLYVTEDIQTRSSLIQGIQQNPFQGTPLAMEMNVMGMTMKYEAKAFNRTFDKSVFNIDKSGYREMDLEQLQRMGMGGF